MGILYAVYRICWIYRALICLSPYTVTYSINHLYTYSPFVYIFLFVYVCTMCIDMHHWRQCDGRIPQQPQGQRRGVRVHQRQAVL